MSKTKYPGVKRLPSGGIEYRGTKFAGFNKPKRSNRAGKKGMVLAKEGDKVKTIRFGQQGTTGDKKTTARARSLKARPAKTIKTGKMSAARKSFKARHGKNIAKGKMSAAYWANKELWSKGGSKKSPPKSQKHKKYGRKKK